MKVHFLRKCRKGGGTGGRTAPRQLEFYFNPCLFVQLLFVQVPCFFLSLFITLFVRSFSFSSLFKGTTLIWMEYRINHFLFVSAFVCSKYIYCMIISAPVKRNFEDHCVDLLRCHMAVNSYCATMKWFHAWQAKGN